jgi:tetratricopeptide (TPR) repeat protein
LPYVSYSYYLEEEFKRRGVKTLNQFWDAHEDQDKSDLIQGTIIVGANILSAGFEVGLQPLRNLQPTERYGNLLIFRGAFHLPKQPAWRLYLRGIDALYSPKRDLQRAEQLFQEALDWNTASYASAIELGNLRAARGARDEAIRAFEVAQAHAPEGETIGDSIAKQISLLRSQDPRKVLPLRDPILE